LDLAAIMRRERRHLDWPHDLGELQHAPRAQAPSPVQAGPDREDFKRLQVSGGGSHIFASAVASAALRIATCRFQVAMLCCSFAIGTKPPEASSRQLACCDTGPTRIGLTSQSRTVTVLVENDAISPIPLSDSRHLVRPVRLAAAVL
jgi:hypothetical protein